ncbi:hypothetical protein GCWB2_18070 [Gordonia rubripertincta]|nr:hypothetical protein GCWB2_18070 [Gordonia rubripertincta]
MPQNGIRQFIITLSSSQRTHTHQLHTPTRALTSRPGSDYPRHTRLRGNSSSLPDPHHDPQTRSPRPTPETQPPQTASKTQRLEPQIQGRSATNPISTPQHQTLSGRPGRRRGALTRHKLRTWVVSVKSPGQRVRPGINIEVGVHTEGTAVRLRVPRYGIPLPMSAPRGRPTTQHGTDICAGWIGFQDRVAGQRFSRRFSVQPLPRALKSARGR